MPNHVHVLIETLPGWPLDSILHSWKSYTSKRILALLEGDRPASRRRSQGRRAAGAPEPPALQLWQREYWDRCVRDERHYAAVVHYIHHNPVKAGLAPTPEAWPFSSAGSVGGPPASNLRTEHTQP